MEGKQENDLQHTPECFMRDRVKSDPKSTFTRTVSLDPQIQIQTPKMPFWTKTPQRSGFLTGVSKKNTSFRKKICAIPQKKHPVLDRIQKSKRVRRIHLAFRPVDLFRSNYLDALSPNSANFIGKGVGKR